MNTRGTIRESLHLLRLAQIKDVDDPFCIGQACLAAIRRNSDCLCRQTNLPKRRVRRKPAPDRAVRHIPAGHTGIAIRGHEFLALFGNRHHVGQFSLESPTHRP